MINNVRILRFHNSQSSIMESTINELIEDGYQPIGKLEVFPATKSDGEYYLIQQMVKSSQMGGIVVSDGIPISQLIPH